ncbi:MAG: sortase [Candidatus Shapirobacteria bacterium]|nr:sortase [Candidatus Shapirobacteria bacterium]
MLDFFRLVPKKRVVKIRSRNGIIFHNPPGNKKYIFYIGTTIFLVAIVYLLYLYWPLGRSIITYNNIQKNEGSQMDKIKEEIIKEKTEEKRIVKEEFSIRIPRIGAESEIKKNVSPYDKKEYLPVLEQDIIAHARDTSLPGENEKAMYLFAHSTRQGIQMVRNNSVFYLLGEMKNDDPIFITYNEKLYIYKVFDQKVVGSSEVEYLNYKQEGKEVLILQTCWPLGTDWKRLLIFAERI